MAGTVEWRRQLRVHSSNDDDADEAFYNDAAVLRNPGAHSNPLQEKSCPSPKMQIYGAGQAEVHSSY